MSVVQNRSDVFAMQKLASGSVHGRTLPDRLFSKAMVQYRAMDGGGFKQLQGGIHGRT